MTRETVAELLLDMESDRIERSNAKTFDEQPCTRSNLTDLNINAFKVIYLPTAIDSETLAANHREPQDQLSSLGLYDLQYDCCTHAGVLLLAENPRGFIPRAYIQYVRFSGKEMDVSAVEAEKLPSMGFEGIGDECNYA